MIKGYQLVISPAITALSGGGGCCRFSPTCSEYAIQALQQHGVFRGSWLTMKRILRCHPWGGAGYDPVPVKAGYEQHEKYMRYAIELAASVDPAATAPNPRVGCVIVESGEIVAEGAHQQDGGAHAEVEALQDLGRPPVEGATLYVTLEPCSTPGRTGACCDRILEASGIQRVVIGATDPNPAHRGRAVEVLEAAGLKVISGCLSDECEALNPDFNLRMREL